MFGSQALETGLGLLFFFLIFSLVVTALADIVAATLRLKAENLRKGLEALLQQAEVSASTVTESGTSASRDNDGGSSAGDINANPPTQNSQTASARALQDVLNRGTQANLLTQVRPWLLAKPWKGFRPPEAINADDFVVNLLETLFDRADRTTDALKSLDQRLKETKRRSTVLLGHADDVVYALPDSRLKRDLERCVSRALEGIETLDGERQEVTRRAAAVRDALYEWFDVQTAEIGDWYRQHMKLVTFLIGFIGAVAINANPVQVGQQLWAEPQFTAELNAALIDNLDRLSPTGGDPSASAPATDGQPADGEADPSQAALIEEIEDLRAKIDRNQADLMAFPIGWTDQRWKDHFQEPGADTWLSSIVGWLIAAFAATLGAPFWFDLLKKVIALRSRVSQRNEAATQARAEDRADKAGPS